MRSSYRFVAGLTVVCCGGVVLLNNAIARGQNQNAPVFSAPVAPTLPTAPIVPVPDPQATLKAPSSPAPLNSLVIKPAAQGKGRFDVDVNNVNLAKLIEELARLANKKALISDELRRKPLMISEFFKNQTPTEMMDSLTTLTLPDSKAMAWGSTGTDTWLVVLHRAPIFSTRIIQTPGLPYVLPPTPPGNSLNLLIPYRDKDKLPPDATPFSFNGGTYYYVPLQK